MLACIYYSMKTFVIILISLFTTGITANSYCDQQYQQLQTAANNIKQKCAINDITIKTCCDLNPIYFLAKPSVYQMQCWCGGKWSTTSVYCDTETADGGWTVIQRRVDGSVDFNRSWSDYEKGFGNLNGEFWYGLKPMNCLTQTGQWELRVDFEFKNKTRSYLHYKKFKVGNATDEYPLTIGDFNGITPTDPFSLHSHNGRKFTTYDNQNAAVTCGKNTGGWWYNRCFRINLNYQYNPTRHGFVYLAGTWYNPRWIEMKIRPLNCTPQ